MTGNPKERKTASSTDTQDGTQLHLLADAIAAINTAASVETILSATRCGVQAISGVTDVVVTCSTPDVHTNTAPRITVIFSQPHMDNSSAVTVRAAFMPATERVLDAAQVQAITALLTFAAGELEHRNDDTITSTTDILSDALARMESIEEIQTRAVAWIATHFGAQSATLREIIPEAGLFPGTHAPLVIWGNNPAGRNVYISRHTLETKIDLGSRPDNLLTLSRAGDTAWSPSDGQEFKELAGVVERHLQRVIQRQRATIQEGLLDALRQLTVDAATASDLTGICSTVHEAVRKLIPHDSFMVALNPPYEPPSTVYHAENGVLYPTRPAIDPIVVAMESTRPVVIRNIKPAAFAENGSAESTQHARSLVTAPLLADGVPVGVLIVGSCTTGTFQWEHAELLASIAQGTGGAFERYILQEQMSRQTRRDAALRAVAERIGGTLDAGEMIALASNVIFDTLPSDHVLVLLVNRHSNTVQARAFRTTTHQLSVPDVGYALDAESFSYAAIDQMTQLVVQQDQLDAYSTFRDAGWPIPDAAVATPIPIDNQRAGVIILARVEQDDFAEDDLSLQRQIAAMLSTALQNATAHEDRLRYTADLSELQRLGASIASQLDLQAGLQEILQSASKLVGADGSAIGIIRGKELDIVGRLGIVAETMPDRLHLDGVILKMVLESSGPIAVNDLGTYDLDGLEPPITADTVRGLMAIPLIDPSETAVGVLGVFTAHPRTWTERDASLLVTLAASAALAIQNARHFEHTRNLLRASVESLTAAVEAKDSYTQNHSREVARISRHIADELGLDAETTGNIELAGLLHDVGKIGIPDSVIERPGDLDASEWAAIQLHPVIGEQILSGNPILSPLLPMVRHHHERWDGHGYPDRLSKDEIPLGSAIIAVAEAVETITSDRPYQAARSWRSAIAEIQAGRGSQFSPQVVDAFMRAIGRGMFPYLELRGTGWREPTDDVADRREPPLDVRALRIFEGVAREIRAHGNIDTFLYSVVALLKEVFETPYIALYIKREQDEPLSLFISIPDAPNAPAFDKEIQKGGGIVGWVATHGVPQNVGDVTQDQRYYDGGYSEQVLSELCVPLLAEGEVIGVINLESDERDAFSNVDERLMISTADHLANAIHVVQLHERLKKISATDALTGLQNHRSFFERLGAEIAHSTAEGTDLSIAILDVNNLKTINDSHGHLAGDAALRSIAGILVDAGRATDVPCRYGGDEFAIILPDTSADVAWETLDHIAAELEASEFEVDGQRYPLPTASWGIATAPDDGQRPFELLRTADDRMYMGKRCDRC